MPARERGGTLAGHVALLGTQLCFGLFPVFGRTAMAAGRGFDPFVVAAWRMAGGALLVGAVAVLVYRRRVWPRRGEWGRLALLSLLGIVANQALYLSGLARSSATDAGLMMCTIPVFTFAVAVAFGQERFAVRRAAGVLVSLAGVVPLCLGRGQAALSEHAVGNLLMLGNCLCYAFYLVLSKPLRAHTPAVVLLGWNYALALPFLPLFLWGRSPLPAAAHDTTVWASLAYVVVFPTVVGYLLNVFALGRLRASTTAVYIYLQPSIAALGGWWFLHERVTPLLGLAALALFLGVWLVTRSDAPRRRLDPSPESPESP